MPYRTILVPVGNLDAFEDAPSRLGQLAWLARRFDSHVVLLHAVDAFDFPAGLLESGDEITARDLRSQPVLQAEQSLARLHLPTLEGIPIERILLRGDPVKEIAQTVVDHHADLILMPSRAGASVHNFFLSSVAAGVLRECVCPVWTGTHFRDSAARDFAVHRVLCAVDLTTHNRHTAGLAASFAEDAGAKLTLIHITTGVERWGPGGMYVDAEWKKTLTDIAAKEIAQLQRDLGTDADVLIDSGNATELLSRAAETSNADVLVIGRKPGRSHLGGNSRGAGIIGESCIPVLSV